MLVNSARFKLRNPNLAFRIFSDDDNLVAYDALSGDTHQLTVIGHEICLRLARSSASSDELKGDFLAAFPDDDPLLVCEGIDLNLAELETSGLIVILAN